MKIVNAVEESYKEYVQAKLFKGLGKLDGKYHIQLKDNAVPYAVNTPRRISRPLMPKVKDKLVELERQGVISKEDQPTDWCAPIVAVPKSNGDVRVCVDLTKLNDQVKRERLMLPSVDDVLSQLRGAKVFSKLDANSCFYHIELTPEWALLTTFINPFGRFCYNRLPFGITTIFDPSTSKKTNSTRAKRLGIRKRKCVPEQPQAEKVCVHKFPNVTSFQHNHSCLGAQEEATPRNNMVGELPKGNLCCVASQMDLLTVDEIDHLASELEECRRQYKILSEKLDNKKELKRELTAEDMLRDEECVKFYTGLYYQILLVFI